MKKFLAAVVASVALMTSACSSVEAAKVDPATIHVSNAEAVAIVQCVTLGLTLFFHFIPLSEASLDTVVNKMLVAEAKALGGNKVQLIYASETPKQGLIFRLLGNFMSVTAASAIGIAVK